MDFTSRVLANPGAPVIKQCPPANNAIRICSITSRWPTITFASSASICARPVVRRCTISLSAWRFVALASGVLVSVSVFMRANESLGKREYLPQEDRLFFQKTGGKRSHFLLHVPSHLRYRSCEPLEP